jgi:hypothetical protein
MAASYLHKSHNYSVICGACGLGIQTSIHYALWVYKIQKLLPKKKLKSMKRLTVKGTFKKD